MTRNKLWPEDLALFERMEKEYVSEQEKEFFEKLRYKEENIYTYANDLIMWELSNEDHIYIVRCRFSEYDIGHGVEGKYDEEQHTMNLYEALNIKLKEVGYLDRDITLHEWLREINYAGVEYNHNYDDL